MFVTVKGKLWWWQNAFRSPRSNTALVRSLLSREAAGSQLHVHETAQLKSSSLAGASSLARTLPVWRESWRESETLSSEQTFNDLFHKSRFCYVSPSGQPTMDISH